MYEKRRRYLENTAHLRNTGEFLLTSTTVSSVQFCTRADRPWTLPNSFCLTAIALLLGFCMTMGFIWTQVIEPTRSKTPSDLSLLAILSHFLVELGPLVMDIGHETPDPLQLWIPVPALGL